MVLGESASGTITIAKLQPQTADKALVAQTPAARISLIILFAASLYSGGIYVW